MRLGVLASACLLAGCASPDWMRADKLPGDDDSPVVSRVYPNASPHAPKERATPRANTQPVKRLSSEANNKAAGVESPRVAPPDEKITPSKPLRINDEVIDSATRSLPPAGKPVRLPPTDDVLPDLVTTQEPVSGGHAEEVVGAVVQASLNDALAESATAKPESVKSASLSLPDIAETPAADKPVKESSQEGSKDDEKEVKTNVSSETPELSPPKEESAKPAEYQAGDWIKNRDALISALQEEIRLAKSNPDRTADLSQLETVLRLQQALAGKRDDAAKVIDGLKPAEQEFWKHYASGLVELVGPDRNASDSRRFAIALNSLEQAQSHLAAASMLTLKNMALCRKVQDFGRIERFDRNEFARNQEVLLYVEIRNFAAAKKDDHTFETELQGSYRVLDRAGVAKAERTLPLDKQTCANLRRDYYIAYRLYIPGELPPGAYTLELTIEDRKAGKSNNGLIDFNVRN